MQRTQKKSGLKVAKHLAIFYFLTYPHHTEVQLGLLSTLKDQLKAALALIGHPVVVVALQDSLLLQCEHRPQVHLTETQHWSINYPIKTTDNIEFTM